MLCMHYQKQPKTISTMGQIKVHGLLLVQVLYVSDIGHCDHLTIPLCIVVSMCISTNHRVALRMCYQMMVNMLRYSMVSKRNHQQL